MNDLSYSVIVLNNFCRFIYILIAFSLVFAVVPTHGVLAAENCNTYTFEKLGVSLDLPSEYVTLTLNPDTAAAERAESNGLKVDLAVSDMRANNVYLMSLDYSTWSRYILCAEKLDGDGIGAAERRIKEKLEKHGREYLPLGEYAIGNKTFIKYSVLFGGNVISTSYSTVHGDNLISLARLGDDSDGLDAFVAACTFSMCKTYADIKEKICVTLGAHTVNIPLGWTKTVLEDGKTEYLDFESRDSIKISAVRCDSPVLCGCDAEPKLCSSISGGEYGGNSRVYALYDDGVQYFISYTSQNEEKAALLAEMSLESFSSKKESYAPDENDTLLRSKNGKVNLAYTAVLCFLALCAATAIFAVAVSLMLKACTAKKNR